MCHLVFSSFQFAWLSRIVFSPCHPFSKLSSFSCFLCSSDFSCSISSTSSILVTAYFLVCFGLTAFTNFFHILFHTGRMKTSVTSFVCSARRTSLFSSFSNPLVRPIAPPTRFSSCPLESSAQCSCFRCTIPAVGTRRCFPRRGPTGF